MRIRLILAGSLAALALLLLVTAVVRHDARSDPSAAAETAPTDAAPAEDRSVPENDRSVPEEASPVSFRESVIHLSFGQSSDTLGYLFLMLTADELPREPYTVVRHLDGEFSIGMDLEASREEVERLLEQVRVEGAGNIFYTNMDSFPTRPVLRMTDLQPETVVTLGDLPPITIVKKEPLGVTLEYEDPQTPTPGLFVHAAEHEWAMPVAVVPDRHPNLVLRFSEEMDHSPNPDLPAGEWIDAYRYRLHLPGPEFRTHGDRVSMGGSLYGFRSAIGNYVSHHRLGYTVIQVKDSDWLDPLTGARIGWSENDPFYESIVFSPDGESYAGAVVVGWPEGDGTGGYYRLMLERKDGTTAVIEPYFHTGMLHLGSPVQWAGDDRAAYADFQSLYVYDVNDGTRRTLFSVAGTKWHILHAAYDPWAKQWNVMTGSFDAPDGSDFGPYWVGFYLLDDEGRTIAHRPEWSLSPAPEYMLMEHPVIPAENGVYRTFYRDGRPFTRFEGRDGSEAELPGAIQYADERRAILLEYEEGKPILYAWDPHLQRLIVNSEAPGFIRAAGPMPVSASPSGYYYRYDAESDEWVRWASEQSVSLPSHRSSGMYKKH